MSTPDSRRFLMAVASLGLAISVAFAQSRPTPAPVIVGIVEGVATNVIYVKTGGPLAALIVDDRTEIWKGKVFHDLSPVQVSDDIIARYRVDPSGKLVAESVWLNVVNVFGIITKIRENEFEIFTNPNADPQSAYKKETKIIQFDAKTMFEGSAREDLRGGRDVQVVGGDLKNRTILATKVTIYEGDRPVRMKPGRVTLPNGQVR